jgi:hypothetical protein
MSTKVIKCKKCGEEVAPNSKFCKSCGAKVSGRNTKRIMVFALSAVVLIVTASFLIMYESPHKKEAKENIEYYNASVAECNHLIEIGDEENPEPWIRARHLLDTIVRQMDGCYYDVYPDVYCQAGKIEGQLFPKLKYVAKLWSDKAERRIREKGNVRESIKEFEYSLLLWDDNQVREKLLNAHKLTIGKELNSLNNKLNLQMQQ